MGLISISASFYFIQILFIYFRQRGREGEKEGEKHQCVVASHVPPTGDLTWLTAQASTLTGNPTGDPLVCRLALNPLSHTSQGHLPLILKIKFIAILIESITQ